MAILLQFWPFLKKSHEPPATNPRGELLYIRNKGWRGGEASIQLAANFFVFHHSHPHLPVHMNHLGIARNARVSIMFAIPSDPPSLRGLARLRLPKCRDELVDELGDGPASPRTTPKKHQKLYHKMGPNLDVNISVYIHLYIYIYLYICVGDANSVGDPSSVDHVALSLLVLPSPGAPPGAPSRGQWCASNYFAAQHGR